MLLEWWYDSYVTVGKHDPADIYRSLVLFSTTACSCIIVFLNQTQDNNAICFVGPAFPALYRRFRRV